MNAKRRLEGFRASVEDHRNSSHFFEEVDGDRRQWENLSAQGKLEYIGRDAALYDVPFEHFADAARDSIGESALMEAALRTVLRDALAFRSLERLLPPDGRTESTPLADRFKEILASPSGSEHAPEQIRERGIER